MKSRKVFQFDENYVWSQGEAIKGGVRGILLDSIPGSTDVHEAGEFWDKKGIDYFVSLSSGGFVAIDTKVREKDFFKLYGHDDLALETWSVLPTLGNRAKIGWTLDESKRTDYILFFWRDSGRFCLIPFLMLLSVFKDFVDDWCLQYKVAKQRTYQKGASWQSECVFVPRKEVWKKIYKKFGGQG